MVFTRTSIKRGPDLHAAWETAKSGTDNAQTLDKQRHGSTLLAHRFFPPTKVCRLSAYAYAYAYAYTNVYAHFYI